MHKISISPFLNSKFTCTVYNAEYSKVQNDEK